MKKGYLSQTWDEFFASIKDGTLELDDDDFIETLPKFTDEEIAEMHRRRFPPRRPFTYNYYMFDVLDGGEWYRIDASVPRSEFYEDVPESVQEKAKAAIDAMVDAAIGVLNSTGETPHFFMNRDNTQEYEGALRSAFDDVRFIETNFEPDYKFY